MKVDQQLESTAPLPIKKHGRQAVSPCQRGFRLLQSLLDCPAGRPPGHCRHVVEQTRHPVHVLLIDDRDYQVTPEAVHSQR